MACELPADSGVPLSRWSSSELAREAITRGIVEQISGVTVWRWLSQDAIKSTKPRSTSPSSNAKSSPPTTASLPGHRGRGVGT